MLDLTDHQDATLAGLFQKRLEYSHLFLQREVLSMSAPTSRNNTIANYFCLDEPVALLTDPANGQSGYLSSLLQAHCKSQWQNHRLRLAQLLDSDGIGDGLHRTCYNFFPACNSDHGGLLGSWSS